MNNYILVVDDDPNARRLFSRVAVRTGYDVKAVKDGLECMEQIYKETPALILLDIMMPVLDGFEVVLRLQADPTLKDIPIVAITAADSSRRKQVRMLPGVSEVVPKAETSTTELLAILNQYIKPLDKKQEEPSETKNSAENGKKPDANTKKPDVNAKKPDANAKKPDANAKKPDANAKKLDADAKKLDADAKKPDANAKKLDADAKKPDVTAKKSESNGQG